MQRLSQIKSPEDGMIALIDAIFQRARFTFERSWKAEADRKKHEPNDSLLEITEFYFSDWGDTLALGKGIDAWKSLVLKCTEKYGFLPPDCYCQKKFQEMC